MSDSWEGAEKSVAVPASWKGGVSAREATEKLKASQRTRGAELTRKFEIRRS